MEKAPKQQVPPSPLPPALAALPTGYFELSTFSPRLIPSRHPALLRSLSRSGIWCVPQLQEIPDALHHAACARIPRPAAAPLQRTDRQTAMCWTASAAGIAPRPVGICFSLFSFSLFDFQLPALAANTPFLSPRGLKPPSPGHSPACFFPSSSSSLRENRS